MTPPKWYHKAVVIIMLSSITPVVIFQLHLLERITLQDEMIKHMKNNYNRMGVVSENLKKRFFPEVKQVDVKMNEKRLMLQLIYENHYNKEWDEKYGLKGYRY